MLSEITQSFEKNINTIAKRGIGNLELSKIPQTMV